ncbi:mitochondrial-processing peptidase subunit beta [Culex quinquefasciatus]|uniref:Mitochondrial-processing peptidase subunit beta n=1 Tax=Culex quinquefasciatus TaxID=7176 RepID=B0XJK5_CULQU|nr:mitochondrial-processing peptidase subunit beta [Culex quinquefasciatus]|eukprot:XP_001869827.1 mitochondrial-processing peptidase subunit beta [Culex quinquefasciatus]
MPSSFHSFGSLRCLATASLRNCRRGLLLDRPDNVSLMVDNTMISACYCTQGDGLNSTSKTAEANLCHIFQLFNTCYKDNGLSRACIMHRMITDSVVDRAKNLLKTNMLLQLDSTTPICEDIGCQMLCDIRRIPLHELEKRIYNVNAKNMRDVAINRPLPGHNRLRPDREPARQHAHSHLHTLSPTVNF